MCDVLLRPGATWQLIREEEGGLVEAFMPYTLFVGLIPVLVGSLLSAMIWGIFGVFLGERVFGTTHLFLQGLASYVYWMVALLACGKIVQLVAPTFHRSESGVLSCRVLVYASTPSFIAVLFSWIPLIGSLISLVALLWSLLLMFQGFQSVLKGVPSENGANTVVPKANVSNSTIEVIHS